MCALRTYLNDFRRKYLNSQFSIFNSPFAAYGAKRKFEISAIRRGSTFVQNVGKMEREPGLWQRATAPVIGILHKKVSYFCNKMSIGTCKMCKMVVYC